MRILHCILTREVAGSELVCCNLASLQARAGHSVQLAIKAGSPLYQSRMAQEALPAQISVLPSRLPGLKLHRVVRSFRPEILHTHLGRATLHSSRVARWNGIPHIATLHVDWRRYYGPCDGIICVARWQRSIIPPGFPGRVAVVPNWTRGSGPVAAQRLTSAGTIAFGSVGRLVPVKGMDILIEAFRAAFPRADRSVALLIVGDGPQRAQLERLADGDDRIVFTGYRDDVLALYGAFDVYVSASLAEPFGLTILEAMGAGCNLVCTETEGAREILAEEAGVGWATPGDVRSLAEALKSARGKSAGVAWNLNSFDPTRAMKAIDEFYGELLNTRKPPSPLWFTIPTLRRRAKNKHANP